MIVNMIFNAFNGMKAIAFDPNDNARPVVAKNEKTSIQLVRKGDVIFFKNVKDKTTKMVIHGDDIDDCWNKSEDLPVYGKTIGSNKNFKKFLNSSDPYLNTNENKDIEYPYELGKNLHLDKFFFNVNEGSIAAGFIGLEGDAYKPQVTIFDVDKIYTNNKPKLKGSGLYAVKNLVLPRLKDAHYCRWLSKKAKPQLHPSNPTWRHAKKIPSCLTINCLMNNGKIIRHNDIVIIYKDGNEKILSLLDMATYLKPSNINFISVPVELDMSKIDRVMYVLHDKNLSKNADTVIWLYRNR